MVLKAVKPNKKVMAKQETVFQFYNFIFFQNEFFSILEVMQTNIRNILLPICHIKFGIVRTVLIHLTQIRFNLCFQYAAALALNINLQATEKIRTLLYKQYHKKLFTYKMMHFVYLVHSLAK